jgi:alpha-glucosidase (family GH31 glycosyl hydrolase)
MQAYVRWLHASGRRAVLITDPGIRAEAGYAPYEQGLRRDVFLRALDGSPYLGGCVELDMPRCVFL